MSDCRTVPYLDGDGVGPEVLTAARRVIDHAVEKAYGGARRIDWLEVLAGDDAYYHTGSRLPVETIEAIRENGMAIKGPLRTPVGTGVRSPNLALARLLDLYASVRPVRWLEGVPSPVRRPELVDMVIIRETTEDYYAGWELEAESPEAVGLLSLLQAEFGWEIRSGSGVGIKPVSETGSKRLIRAAVQFALANSRRSVTLLHNGNTMQHTEGAFKEWGYEVVREEFAGKAVIWKECGGDPGALLPVRDITVGAFLHKAFTRPSDFDVVVTLNLNGDYIADALAARVGGVGMAPGGNFNFQTGHGLFEATHGTATKYAGLNRVNPGALLVSGEMMLRYIGWPAAANLVTAGMKETIRDKILTYDLARLTNGATEVGTSGFATAVIDRM